MPRTLEMRATLLPDGEDPGAVAGDAIEEPQEPHEVDSLIGQVVADRYRVEACIGEGGIGRVYRAMHLQLGRAVALKLLHGDLAGRREMKVRFEREARAASKLSHPGSVMVYDFGSWDGMLYLVMELVEGRSLDEVMREDGPLPVGRIVELGAQLCDALEAAHALGLLHRDLKPENVLVTRGSDGRDVAKICDYGLAYVMGDASLNMPRLTREGTVAGTPAFMAPEQVLNRVLDQRADLYALGCVLYEMACGKAPFDGDSPMEILTKQLYDEPEPPSRRSLRAVPAELERAILWALKKAPAARPQRAAELKAALLGVLETGGKRTDRPTNDEVQVLFDREARAEAAGIAPPPARTTADFVAGAQEVPVVALGDVAFEQSAVATLRANGVKVRIETAIAACAGAEGMVIDMRGDASLGLVRLAEAQKALPWLATATVIVVGPDDDFAAMSRALELHAAEYVPASLIATLPRKLHRALGRARRNRS